MVRFFLRCIVATLSLLSTIMMFYNGYWGWGIVLILLTCIVGLSFFRNENMVLALNSMRTGDTEKASKYINKIKYIKSNLKIIDEDKLFKSII